VAETAARTFVIAEAGVNHNGDLQLALRVCDAAREAGADAVKFQTFRAADLVVPGAPTAEYQQRQTGAQDQYAMLQALELSEDQHRAIQAHCHAIGIEFFSTPFSIPALRMLVMLGVRRIKLSSGELTHRALVEAAAATGLPLLLSTGMATMEEIREALGWVRSARGGSLHEVTVFHCTSAYPAPDSDLNLRAIPTMARDLGVPVGYSDHSDGVEAALAAVALGARVIEKHMTLDRTLPGPDHAASLEPADFARMVTGIRRVEVMGGDNIKAPTAAERDTARVARRSVALARDVAVGTVLTEDLLVCRRPATGIAPRDLGLVLGQRVRSALPAHTILQWEHLELGRPGAGGSKA
jgi:N,N'-diacetyllegionaminate synthase